jgi:hypothetical protein
MAGAISQVSVQRVFEGHRRGTPQGEDTLVVVRVDPVHTGMNPEGREGKALATIVLTAPYA